MPSKFGGIPVEETPEKSKFGGVPVDDEAQPTAPTKAERMIPAGASIAPLKPAGPFGAVARWLGDVADDVRHGTTATLPGRILHSMGAPGTDTGVSHDTGEFMAGPVIGPIRVAKGVTELPQGEFKQGAKDIAGGAWQAAQIPLGMIGPDAPIEAVDNIIPSTARAGKKFESVMSKAADVVPNIAKAGDNALRIRELAEHGGTQPKVVRDFISRTTNPNLSPVTYRELRDFASNASRLSADESKRITPIVKREVGAFSRALNKANAGAAEQVGMRPVYESAMKEYRDAARLKDVAKTVGKAALKTAGGYAAYKSGKEAGIIR